MPNSASHRLPKSSQYKTPREYLSYSQMVCLERSERDYVAKYLRGEQGYVSEEMNFGKHIAEGLLDPRIKDVDIQFLLTFLPNAGSREYEIRTEHNGIKLLGYIDSFKKSPMIVREYKTGKIPWSQQRADKMDQLTFYDMLCWLKWKKRAVLWLDWIPTVWGPDGLMITRNIHSFKTTRSMADILRMMGRVERAWKRIKELSKEYGKQN